MLLQETQNLRPIPLPFRPHEMARRMQRMDGFVYLDSSLSTPDSYSVLAAQPLEILSGNIARDWEHLERRVAGYTHDSAQSGIGPSGAAIGWVGYDGDFVFGIYPELLVYAHGQRCWYGNGGMPTGISSHAPDLLPGQVGRFANGMTEEEFCAMVRRAKEYIAAGDIYQVCLSYPFHCEEWGVDSWAFYESLRGVSPVPHAAFLRLGGCEVLSASPETFLKMDGRKIVTRPIKGTCARYENLMEDDQAAKELTASEKEAAELVMITDLERNDLGRVSEYGSVWVKDMLKLERYRQVYHMVSTVEGTLREGCSHFSAFKSCFPGGSISGAPKIRAREIISELESYARGLYTGAIGYFGFDGRSQFSIAIRTLVARDGKADFHVGAGIVADSCPSREWKETWEKAAALLQAAQPFLT